MPRAEVISARKRCVSMGRYHAWRPDFDAHPLAACLDNHTKCLDAELEEAQPDWLEMMIYICIMARRINWFCAANKISDDVAAQYWLERFLWRCNMLFDFDVMQYSSYSFYRGRHELSTRLHAAD